MEIKRRVLERKHVKMKESSVTNRKKRLVEFFYFDRTMHEEFIRRGIVTLTLMLILYNICGKKTSLRNSAVEICVFTKIMRIALSLLGFGMLGPIL
jgi:hypothetical protein